MFALDEVLKPATVFKYPRLNMNLILRIFISGKILIETFSNIRLCNKWQKVELHMKLKLEIFITSFGWGFFLLRFHFS